MRPLIGITAYTHRTPDRGWLYDVCYASNAQAIQRAGGLPVLVPANLHESTLHDIYARLDGVLLPGGGDVSPTNYGMDDHPTLTNVDDTRDFAELKLAQWAVEDDRPVFGICRGIQVLNVALGGTLTIDIPSMLPTTLAHDIPRNQPRNTLMHTVNVQPQTRLAQILGGTQFIVNSLHHQALQQIPEHAVPTAYSPDGIIEAIEVPSKHFVLGVQWHPEDLTADEDMQRLFVAFVDACRQTMKL